MTTPKTPKQRKALRRTAKPFAPASGYAAGGDLRSPLAKARDHWLESAEGLSCANPLTLKTTAEQRQYLENRLVTAFVAGATWMAAHVQKRKRHSEDGAGEKL